MGLQTATRQDWDACAFVPFVGAGATKGIGCLYRWVGRKLVLGGLVVLYLHCSIHALRVGLSACSCVCVCGSDGAGSSSLTNSERVGEGRGNRGVSKNVLLGALETLEGWLARPSPRQPASDKVAREKPET